MRISFIVPVYNTSNTLERCVDSIRIQSLDECSYEVILINDGSTDESEEICLEICRKHPCTRLVSQENLGLSAARNRGIQVARGEYLCFVDSDDTLVPGGIGLLLPYCDGNNDLIRYWCELVDPVNKSDVDMGDGQVTFNGSGREYLRIYGLETFCLNYLYKKAFLERNQLRFTLGIIGEDFPFIFDVMKANPSIISVAKRIYRYNINPNSISTTRSPEHSRRWVTDLMGSMYRIAGELEPMRDSDPALFKSCRRSLDGKMVALFSRILSANYTTKEYKSLLNSCREAKLLPLQTQPNTVINLLARFPILYPVASTLYRRLFLPFIYPRINRYGS